MLEPVLIDGCIFSDEYDVGWLGRYLQDSGDEVVIELQKANGYEERNEALSSFIFQLLMIDDDFLNKDSGPLGDPKLVLRAYIKDEKRLLEANYPGRLRVRFPIPWGFGS